MKTGLIIIAMALVSGTVMAQEAKVKSEGSVKVNNSVQTGHQKTAAKMEAKADAKTEASAEREAVKLEKKTNKEVKKAVKETKGTAKDAAEKGSEVSAAATSITSAEVKAIEKTAEANKGQQVKVVSGSGADVKAAVHAAQDKTVKVNTGATTSTAAQVKVKPVKAKPAKAAVKVKSSARVALP